MDTFNKLSTAGKAVIVGTVAFLIVSIFNWQEVDTVVGSVGRSMWHGWGTLAGLLAIALLVWEGLRLANVNIALPISAAMAGALVAILLALATILKFLVDNEFRTFWSWLGLVLALGIAAGAFVRMQEGGESFADMRQSVTSAASGAAAKAREAVDRDDSPTPPPSSTDDTTDDTRST
jgi:hypothetical protein